jgi:hypothetical protein
MKAARGEPPAQRLAPGLHLTCAGYSLLKKTKCATDADFKVVGLVLDAAQPQSWPQSR